MAIGQVLTPHNMLFALVVGILVLKILHVLAMWVYDFTAVHDLKVRAHELRMRIKIEYAERQLAEEEHKRKSRERRDRGNATMQRISQAENEARDAKADARRGQPHTPITEPVKNAPQPAAAPPPPPPPPAPATPAEPPAADVADVLPAAASAGEPGAAPAAAIPSGRAAA